MSPEDEFQRTFADICVLFELALSVGQSLDLRENCERFLTTLMARKNLGYAAVWLREEILPRRPPAEGAPGEPPGDRDPPSDSGRPDLAGADGQLVLVYGVPRVHVRERVLPPDRTAFLAAAQGPFSVASTDPSFRAFITEQGIDSGVYAIFPLGRLGFLKLHSAVRTSRLVDAELSQLETVIRKFTVSVDGCIAHNSPCVDFESHSSGRRFTFGTGTGHQYAAATSPGRTARTVATNSLCGGCVMTHVCAILIMIRIPFR